MEFPLQEVIQKTGYAYFNNTVSYSLGYAISQEVSDMHLYGIDFTHKDVAFAEAANDIKITLLENTRLNDMVVEVVQGTRGVYGRVLGWQYSKPNAASAAGK